MPFFILKNSRYNKVSYKMKLTYEKKSIKVGQTYSGVSEYLLDDPIQF